MSELDTIKSQQSSVISIVVPTLNEGDLIETLIKSIWVQEYRPIEIVFVDGGSRDSTLEIIQKMKKLMHSNNFIINLFYEKDFGVLRSPGNARNIGVQVANGDFVILFDADSLFLTRDSVGKIKEKLMKNDFIMVKTKIIIDTDIEYELSKIWPLSLHSTTKCGYRKGVFSKVQFNPTLGYGEDGDFWFRAQRIMNSKFILANEISIGMHLPHTMSEYLVQTKWYAKTLPKFVKLGFKENRHHFHISRHFKYVLLGFLGPVLFPMFIVKNMLLNSYDCRNWIFLMWNYIVRRYVFTYYFIRGLKNEKIMKISTYFVIKYFSMYVRGFIKL
jgi:glycosyltransferase involved in cell wall biosynthesis